MSGQNVALVAGGTIVLAWLLGISRLVGEVLALAAIVGYALPIGPQPYVVRAGIAGALGSLAWLAARPRDRPAYTRRPRRSANATLERRSSAARSEFVTTRPLAHGTATASGTVFLDLGPEIVTA